MSFIYRNLFLVSLLILCHYCALLEGSHEFKKHVHVEDTLTEDLLNFLNEERPLYNPHDMLTPPAPSVNDMKPSKNNFISQDNCNCESGNMGDKQCIEQFNHCSSKITEIESNLKIKEQQLSSLQNQLLKDKYIDVDGFYSRILRKFWSLLKFEEAERILVRDNKAIRRHLVVQVTAADIVAFKEFFQERRAHAQIDSFFQDSFQTGTEKGAENGIQSLAEKVNNVLHHLHSFEAWIVLLWILIITAFVWVLVLFVLDTHRKLRWGRVLGMMFILAFLISCVIHWRHMIKVRELKRQNYLERGRAKGASGYAEVTSIWTKMWNAIFGDETDREKYYESMMISPAEEISPMMVFSETIAKFVLLPLADVGRHLGLFFKNFFQTIPLIWQFPAALLFIFMFTICILAYFSYGLHFPFWLGGIYPSRSKDNSKKIKELMRESEKNMKKISQDAKEMLTHISQTAISHSHNFGSQTYSEPIVRHSAAVIERNLERLINEKFSRLISEDGDKTRDYNFCWENRPIVSDTKTSITRCKKKARHGGPVEVKDRVDGWMQLRSQDRFQSTSVPSRRRLSKEEIPKKADECIAGSETSRELCKIRTKLDTGWSTSESPNSDHEDTDFIIKVKSVFSDLTDVSTEEFSPAKNTFENSCSERESFLDSVENLMAN